MSVGLVRVQVVEPPAEAPPPIAVKDTAYLRPGEPTSVPVLANDVSPSGRVLAVQSADDTEHRRPRLGRDPHEHRRARHRLRGARPAAAVQLHHLRRREHGDGDGDGRAGAAAREAPAAGRGRRRRERARRRHRHGAGARERLPPRLDRHPRAARARRHGRPAGARVRRRRPRALPGARRARHLHGRLHDRRRLRADRPRERDVHGGRRRTPARTAPPLPTPLTSRTFAGSAVSIDIPLDGLDPDGDSVVLTGISSAPNLGRVAERTSTSITYEAFAGSTGTDTFALRAARRVRRDREGHDPHRRDPTAGGRAAAEGRRRRDRGEARSHGVGRGARSTTPTRAATA